MKYDIKNMPKASASAGRIIKHDVGKKNNKLSVKKLSKYGYKY
jgi:hypothetical protein